MKNPIKLTDGDHLLPCGATLTVHGGLPKHLTMPGAGASDEEEGDENDGALVHARWQAFATAWSQAEVASGLWLNEPKPKGQLYEIALLDAQPTHTFSGDEDGAREVCLVECDVAGGVEVPYSGRFTVALDRAAHYESEDAFGWPPFLRDGTWCDGWTGKPIEGAKAEALAHTPSA